jgi:diguanylate cyclase (GGDEF)-like protein
VTAVPVSVLRVQQPSRRGFPAPARRYLNLLAAAAVAAAVTASALSSQRLSWRDVVVLLLLAPAAQYFATHGPSNQVFHSGMAFTIAAVLLLPPELIVAVCIAQHLPDWRRQRYPWFIQSFNIVNFCLSAIAGWAIWTSLEPGNSVGGTRAVAAACCAALGFIAVNHALLARMLKLARGRDARETRLFAVDGAVSDAVLAAVGIGFAFTLHSEPALAGVILLPLALIQQALLLPTMREEAIKDHKTGLLNARGIERAGEQELERALRFSRPLSLLVCDVDNLRAINKEHGHLGGDAALTTIADTLCSELRDYDLCGRFGGDEFIVVLPETPLDEAHRVAARIQRSLAEKRVQTNSTDFAVTVSIGAATTSAQTATLTGLTAAADEAMYRAKH